MWPIISEWRSLQLLELKLAIYTGNGVMYTVCALCMYHHDSTSLGKILRPSCRPVGNELAWWLPCTVIVTYKFSGYFNVALGNEDLCPTWVHIN